MSFARKIRLFTLFFLLFPHVRIWAEDPIDDLLEATFRIADKEHSGTCFLVSPKSVDAANPRRVILATAAHVLEQMSGDECEIFLRRKEDDGHYSRQPLTIAIRNLGKPLWTRHPDVDLSSLFLDLPEGVLFNPIPFEMVADEVPVIDRTIRAGKETWIPCYPAKLEANDAGWPVLRHGSIGRRGAEALRGSRGQRSAGGHDREQSTAGDRNRFGNAPANRSIQSAIRRANHAYTNGTVDRHASSVFARDHRDHVQVRSAAFSVFAACEHAYETGFRLVRSIANPSGEPGMSTGGLRFSYSLVSPFPNLKDLSFKDRS